MALCGKNNVPGDQEATRDFATVMDMHTSYQRSKLLAIMDNSANISRFRSKINRADVGLAWTMRKGRPTRSVTLNFLPSLSTICNPSPRVATEHFRGRICSCEGNGNSFPLFDHFIRALSCNNEIRREKEPLGENTRAKIEKIARALFIRRKRETVERGTGFLSATLKLALNPRRVFFCRMTTSAGWNVSRK